MGLFGRTPKVDVESFAKELAQQIAKRYPPALDASSAKKISVNRVTKVLEDALSRASEFTQSNRLGALGKARLGNAFKWELKELGYSERFVDVATEGLIVYVTRAVSAATGGSGTSA